MPTKIPINAEKTLLPLSFILSVAIEMEELGAAARVGVWLLWQIPASEQLHFAAV